MKKELELKLVEKYPVIFQEYGKDITKTCMGWGMSCGDGWYDIIDRLCAKIQDLVEGSDCKVIAVQVKEKFAGLRFYYVSVGCDNETYEKIEVFVDEAEGESFKTCEECGAPGRVRGTGWLLVRCDKCSEEVK